jgi:hypothetical protein
MIRCKGCQLEFEPVRSDQKYHNHKCYQDQYNRKRDPVKVELAKQDFRKRNRERLNQEAKDYYQAHRLEAIEKAKANRFKRKRIGMIKEYCANLQSLVG